MYSYYFIDWGCIGLFYYYLLPEMIIECSPSLLDAHYDFKSSVKKHILTKKFNKSEIIFPYEQNFIFRYRQI